MDLNIELVKAIRETQHAAEKATQSFINILGRYDLTEMGAEQEKQRLFGEVTETEMQAQARAAELIDAKISELDAAEVRAAEKRAMDTDYMSRLQMKINMIRSVDIGKMTDETLKAMFSEFENDPLAIEMIRAAIPGGRVLKIEPANTNGAKQEHLKDVKKAVSRAIGKAGAFISPLDLKSGSIPWKEEVDALASYITKQNADFSKNDAEVWDFVVKNNPELEVFAGAWQMRFSNSR